ncbi:hypothetical protein SSX86_018366 [Deinandra increscens subsp. villosa]|uniref:HMA domain-containing protein n=1 Tax=Deinandra increscens subsp. villosa TaxID=3103831 RepID=A0AAP0GTH7_9ASTR
MSSTTITLRILRFHNCEGCVRKVGIALHQIDEVELVEFDPVTGNLTVSTSKHPEVIRYAIERKTKKQVVILPQDINPSSFTGPAAHHQAACPVNVQELAETLLRVSHAQGLNNVELVGDLHSNSFRLNFNKRLPPDTTNSTTAYTYTTGDGDYEFLPPPQQRAIVEPSAQLPHFSVTSDNQVYGYPPEFYGSCTTCGHDHKKKGCCTIL